METNKNSVMKKRILIICTVLATFSLTPFGFIKWNETEMESKIHSTSPSTSESSSPIVFTNDPLYAFIEGLNMDLVYEVDSRFMHTVTKQSVEEAVSIFDLLPDDASKEGASYSSVKISILHDDGETIATGNSEILNDRQLALLQSAPYSTNLYIQADYQVKSSLGCGSPTKEIGYYMTLVPEREAQYTMGLDNLIYYLRTKSKEETAEIEMDRLQQGMVHFTVTKEGGVENVVVNTSSGYPEVDKTLVRLLENTDEQWIPAVNSEGEMVAQEFVFFFGKGGGC